MSATKRPWSIKHSDDSSYFSIVDCNGGEVADDGSACDEYSKSMQLDTAELIVRAVNCFEDLVASVNELLCKLADKECVSVEELCEETGYGKRARTALAQAKDH